MQASSRPLPGPLLVDVGPDGRGTLNLTSGEAFRTCMDFLNVSHIDLESRISCGGLQKMDQSLASQGECVVTDISDDLDHLNVSVNANGSYPIYEEYAVECRTRRHFAKTWVRVRFKATGVGGQDTGLMDGYVAFSAALIVLILLLAIVTLAYFRSPGTGILCCNDRYKLGNLTKKFR